MPVLSTVMSYIRAIQTAAHGRAGAYPAAAHSVFVSRFRYGIGPRLHSLFRLVDAPREQWSEYIIDERLRTVLRNLNPPQARELANDKLAFHDHCLAHGIPTIPILCFLGKNHLSTPLAVNDAEEWRRRLDAADYNQLFIKLVNGTWGIDAFKAERAGTYWSYCGQLGTTIDLYHFCRERLGGRRGWIVQPIITAHARLLDITSPNALCTIRAITCLGQDGAFLLYAALRIPVGNNVTDNFAHGASGNIIAPLDIETGTLGAGKGSRGTHWPDIRDVTEHPDTKNTITGFMIPYWDTARELLVRAQETLPLLKTIGWDLAITDTGPTTLEANATYDVDLLQVAFKRGLRSELLPRLGVSITSCGTKA